MHSTSRSYGFTVIELVLVVVLLLGAAGLLTWQRNNLAEGYRDEQRKTAINAMYYGLEESFYKEKGYYPLTIADNTLATVDNALLKDPDGVMINTAGSSYRYQPERRPRQVPGLHAERRDGARSHLHQAQPRQRATIAITAQR